MKKTAILLAALSAATGAFAAENAVESKSSYSVTTDFTYASEYIFRGVEAANGSFQPSVEVTAGDIYAGVWSNNPITNRENNEIDLYAGYKYKVNESLSVEAVGTYYWYPEASSSAGATKNSYEAGIGATYTMSGISFTANYYYDFRLEANTVQGSLGYSIPLEAIGSSIDLSAFIGTVDAKDWAPDAAGKSISESYTYYGADVSLPYKLSEKATFTVGAHYATNENLPASVPDSNVWFTAGLTVGF